MFDDDEPPLDVSDLVHDDTPPEPKTGPGSLDLAETGAALVVDRPIPGQPLPAPPPPPPSSRPSRPSLQRPPTPPATPAPSAPPSSPPNTPPPRRPTPLPRPPGSMPRAPTPSGTFGPPSSSGRRMPRGRVAVAAVTTRVAIEVQLQGGDAEAVTLRASLVTAAGLPPLTLPMQQDGLRVHGHAELARPTSEGIELRLQLEGAAGVQWNVEVTSNRRSLHVVGRAEGRITDRSSRSKLTLGG